jgi:hypothetical protein
MTSSFPDLRVAEMKKGTEGIEGLILKEFFFDISFFRKLSKKETDRKTQRDRQNDRQKDTKRQTE